MSHKNNVKKSQQYSIAGKSVGQGEGRQGCVWLPHQGDTGTVDSAPKHSYLKSQRNTSFSENISLCILNSLDLLCSKFWRDGGQGVKKELEEAIGEPY